MRIELTSPGWKPEIITTILRMHYYSHTIMKFLVCIVNNKYNMILYDLLNEAGIRTADIDRAARKELLKVLPETIRLAVRSVSINLPKSVVSDSSELYDRVYNHFLLHEVQLVNYICDAASIAFTNVAKERLNQLAIVPKNRVNTIRVFVEDRDRSTDPYKKYGGYYSQDRNILKIFINGKSLSSSAFELMQEEIFGESEFYEYQKLISIIIPVFVHEYAHLEQNLRSKSTSADFGYITTGVKGRTRQGKRGGYLRNQESDIVSYLRYKGNLDEIDSFASQAAAELMNDALSSSRELYNINDLITQIQQDVATGYHSSDTYSQYSRMLRDAFDGAYADIGLRPQQMEKVWKRFAKRVYQKLNDYKTADDNNIVVKDWSVWSKFASEHSMSDTVRHLAEMASKKIPAGKNARESISLGATFDQEYFINNYYNLDDEKSDRLVAIFRKLVEKYHSA